MCAHVCVVEVVAFLPRFAMIYLFTFLSKSYLTSTPVAKDSMLARSFYAAGGGQFLARARCGRFEGGCGGLSL